MILDAPSHDSSPSHSDSFGDDVNWDNLMREGAFIFHPMHAYVYILGQLDDFTSSDVYFSFKFPIQIAKTT